MRLKLTLHRGEGDPVDIVVTTDSTATAGDVARHIAESDPTRTLAFAEGSALTLAVAPPTDARMVPLHPDVAIGEADRRIRGPRSASERGIDIPLE